MNVSIQEFFGVLLAVLVMFVLPIYFTFEKKDDVSYNLAIKITSDFVNNVKSNGYISNEMYIKYLENLSITHNLYDVRFEHKAMKYYPIIYAYDNDDKIIKEFDYILYKSQYDSGSIIYDGVTYNNLKISFYEAEEIYNTEQILDAFTEESSRSLREITDLEYQAMNIEDFEVIPDLYSNNTFGKIYPLNKGDKFIVELVNTNVTIAESIFNTFTVGVTNFSIPRVYVMYGGIVENMLYLDERTN